MNKRIIKEYQIKKSKEEFKIQAPQEVYYENYDDLIRFISYFYQIKLAKKLKPKNILEIGVGNKTVTNYLKQSELKIDTCDFDKDLKPNYVADIRELPFKNNSYELVMACEIIEHLPWKDVDKALYELQRVSNKYVIISIPYSSAGFELVLRFPLINKILNKQLMSLFVRIPYFFMSKKFDGQHYWEMGRKNYSKQKIRKKMKKYFKIVEEIRPILDHYHHFFVLEKKLRNKKITKEKNL